MIVKKYKGTTETEAFLAAKEDLGPNAVVVNVKQMKQRGLARLFKKDYVEITAALENEDKEQAVVNKPAPKPPIAANNMATGNATQASRATTAANRPAFDVRVEDSTPTKVNAIEKKLDNLSEMLQNQIVKDEEKKPETSHSETAPEENAEDKQTNSMNFKSLKLIYNKLIENETDEKYANSIINDIENSLKKESNLDSILASVYQKLILKLGEPKTIDTEGTKKKAIFFIGPTGVGKTTTIAKLASNIKLNSAKKLAFLTADTYRIAAVEQLNTYASILDVPVEIVYTPSEIVEQLSSMADSEVIMIDTAGRSHKNEEQRREIVEMIENVRNSDLDMDIEVYLVLSVTTKYKDLLSIADAYKEIPEIRLLFTKLDETSTFGNILNIRAYTNASLSYITCGQNVPDDIETVDVQQLAKRLLGGE